MFDDYPAQAVTLTSHIVSLREFKLDSMEDTNDQNEWSVSALKDVSDFAKRSLLSDLKHTDAWSLRSIKSCVKRSAKSAMLLVAAVVPRSWDS